MTVTFGHYRASKTRYCQVRETTPKVKVVNITNNTAHTTD